MSGGSVAGHATEEGPYGEAHPASRHRVGCEHVEGRAHAPQRG
jgi:hypothetical protein